MQQDEEAPIMGLLQDYRECVEVGDASRMASLFAEDAHFYDEAPTKLGAEPISVKGRDNLEAFFKQTFGQGGLGVANVAINGNAIRYDIEVGGMVFLCLGVMQEENNLIKEYRVKAV